MSPVGPNPVWQSELDLDFANIWKAADKVVYSRTFNLRPLPTPESSATSTRRQCVT